MRNHRQPLDYDNRGAELHRPWPKAPHPSRRYIKALRNVIVVLATIFAIAWLADGQSKCAELIGKNSRYCVD